MMALPLSARTLYLCKCPFAYCDAFGMSSRLRYRNRKQKMYRYAKRTGENLMHCHRAFALSGFEIRQITLGDAGSGRQVRLGHLTPFPQDPNWIFASRQAIDDDLGQHNLIAGRDRGTGVVHDPGGADILVSRLSDKPLVFALWQDSEFFAVRRLDELHLGHDGLSVINLSSIPNGCDDNSAALDIEYDAPIADAQPRPGAALEPLHVALSGLGKYREFGLDPPAHIDGKPKPLPRGRAGERDLHLANIAYCDIGVKKNIAYRNRADLL